MGIPAICYSIKKNANPHGVLFVAFIKNAPDEKAGEAAYNTGCTGM